MLLTVQYNTGLKSEFVRFPDLTKEAIDATISDFVNSIAQEDKPIKVGIILTQQESCVYFGKDHSLAHIRYKDEQGNEVNIFSHSITTRLFDEDTIFIV